MFLIFTITFLLMVVLQQTEVAADASIKLATIPGTDGTCPPQKERENAIQNITTSIRAILLEKYCRTTGAQQTDLNCCGEGQWHRVAFLNMSIPSQRCPSAWREYSIGAAGIKTCRRPETSHGSCHGTVYTTRQRYSKVCGRAIGYQIGSTDAFGYLAVHRIDSYYVHGVSVTHGAPRNHIWTFASGLSEGKYPYQRDNCPCSNPSSSSNRYPPSFVGDNYYCESANPTDTYVFYRIYNSDPLWDGQQCEGECCSNGKSPPWFSVELPNPTTDDIEVRICIPQPSHDDVALKVLEIYIQ